MINRQDLISEIDTLEGKPLTLQSCEKLAHFYTIYNQNFNDQPKQSTRYSSKSAEELKDVFPALEIYQNEHTAQNLRSLCNEVEEFCNALFVSTESEKERDIYRQMIKRLIR